MITAEQRAYIQYREGQLYHPEHLEVRVFSGDVYIRIGVAGLGAVTAVDPDGKHRPDTWPERGVTLAEIEASTKQQRAAKTVCGARPREAARGRNARRWRIGTRWPFRGRIQLA